MSYQENILQAVDMVVSQRLNEMNFDKTIVCKVENDTNASKGEYIVSYQAMTMTVYAANPEEEYNKGQDVYVTVPQGDFNLRKIIIGYVSHSEIPTYLYTNPMKYLVSNQDDIIKLPNEYIDLRDYSQESEDLPTIKYLCFSGDFKTEGKPDNPVQTYGINLNFTGVLKETGKDIETSFTFDSSGFQGNPYQFNGYFRQEQLFNIEKYSAIKELSCELYNNNKEGFTVELSNPCVITGYDTAEMPEDAKTGKIVLYEKNAIQKYPTTEQEETEEIEEIEETEETEEAELNLNLKSRFYQNNQVTTVSEEDLTNYPYYNYKWFVYSKGSEDVGNGKHWAQVVIVENNEVKDYKKLEISREISKDDLYYIQYKKEFKQNDEDGSWDGIKQITIPNQEEKILQVVNQVFKVDKIVTKENGNYVKNLTNPQDRRGSSEYEDATNDYTKATETINKETFTYSDLPENYRTTEMEKATTQKERLSIALNIYNEKLAGIVAEEKIATSNTLAIRRSDQYNIEEALKGSGITLTASGDGSYFVYNGTTNQIDPELKRNKTFRITANLTGAAKWRAGETIRWMIPKNGTMIVAPKEKDYEEGALTEADSWYIITQTTEEDVAPILDFDIKDIYDPAATMNVIRCEIGEKNSENYIDDGILLSFGVKGSQGTEYTVSISFEEQDFITPGGSLKLKGHFYDPEGKEIENIEFYWSLSQLPYDSPLLSLANGNNEEAYEPVNITEGKQFTDKDKATYFIKNSNGEYINITDTTAQKDTQYYQKVSVYTGQEVTVNCISDISNIDKYYGIVSISLNYEDRNLHNNINFKTFKAIPIWTDDAETSSPIFTGPTNIVYNFQGNSPDFLDSQYSINNKFDHIEIIGNKNTGFGLSENKELIVPEIISTELPKITVKLKADVDKIWYQPLVIYRNQYTSAVLNSWDGGMQIDEKGNKILTKMIGAGKKNTDNTFSGVFMGAVGQETGDGITGLYGYQNGALRFKFTEKGDAFIGTGSDNYISFNEGNNEELTIRSKHFTLKSENSNKYFYLSSDTPDNGDYINIGNGAIRVDEYGDVYIGETINRNNVSMRSVEELSNEVEIITNGFKITNESDEFSGLTIKLPISEYLLSKLLNEKKTTITVSYEYSLYENGLTAFENISERVLVGCEMYCPKKADPSTYSGFSQYFAYRATNSSNITSYMDETIKIENNKITTPKYLNMWIPYSKSYDLEKATNIPPLNFIIYFEGVCGTFGIRNIKIEVGSKKSDWSLSPEDQINTGNIITQINTSKEGIVIQGDKISLKGKDINLGADEITITSKNFTVDKDGKITASDGKIGGWEIFKTTLGNSFQANVIDARTVGIAPGINTTDLSINTDKNNIGSTKGLCFWAGAKYEGGGTDYGYVMISKAPFRVYSDGSLYASNATISGTIEADTILQNGIKVGTTQNTFFEDWSTNYTRWAWESGRDYAQIVVGHSRIELTTVKYDSDVKTETMIELKAGNIGTTGKLTSYLNPSTYLNLNTSSSGGVTLVGGSWTNRLALNSSQGTLSGTWNASECLANGSDRNIKNSIEEMSANYSMLFDNLKPVRYKYNHGTSNRYHIGFIAQDVEQAVLDSSLTTNEFAGFIKDEKDEYYLRYGEFVALNTLEIQKLKTRVSELETELAEIKEKLQ